MPILPPAGASDNMDGAETKFDNRGESGAGSLVSIKDDIKADITNLFQIIKEFKSSTGLILDACKGRGDLRL